MFGMKIRSWMEAHIVRPRKKRSKENSSSKEKFSRTTDLVVTIPDRPILDSAGNSPTSPLIPNKYYPSSEKSCRDVTNNVCSVELMSVPRPKSFKSTPLSQNYNNLSSPESAYSTGCSSDGTSPREHSPDASMHPEYYINLRTGTHYFQSSHAPTVSHFRLRDRPKDGIVPLSSKLGEKRKTNASNSCSEPVKHCINKYDSTRDISVRNTHPITREIETCDIDRKTVTTPCSDVNPRSANGHSHYQRVESTDENRRCTAIRTTFAQLENTHDIKQNNSPRQRNRIRTNPWLAATSNERDKHIHKPSLPIFNFDTRYIDGLEGGEVKQYESSKSSHGSTYSSSGRNSYSGSDVTLPCQIELGIQDASSNELSNPKELSSCSSLVRCYSISEKEQTWDCEDMTGTLSDLGACSPGQGSFSSTVYSAASSIKDVALDRENKCDKSYVSEKETDILSDSEPTDGEDNSHERSSNHEKSNNEDNAKKPEDVNFNEFISSVLGTKSIQESHNIDCSNSVRESSSNRILKHSFSVGNKDQGLKRKHSVRRSTSSVREADRSCLTKSYSRDSVSKQNILPEANAGNVISTQESNKVNFKLATRSSSSEDYFREANTDNSSKNANNKNNVINSSIINIETKLIPTATARKTVSFSERKDSHVSSKTKLKETGNCAENCEKVSLNSSKIPVSKSKEHSENCGINTKVENENYCKGTNGSAIDSEIKLIEADKEADQKYKELIREAENILTKMKNSRLELQSLAENKDEKYQRAKKKESYERCSVRRRANAKREEPENTKFCKCHCSKLPSTIGHERYEKAMTEKGNSDSSTVSSAIRLKIHPCGEASSCEKKTGNSTGSCRPALMIFRPVDVSNPGNSSYCPQSEPLKRKVYASNTLSRIEKSSSQKRKPLFRNHSFQQGDCYRNSRHLVRSTLEEKVARLRQERLEVEAKIREAQEEQRQRQQEKVRFQYQLTIFRRQMLLHTIENLKRNLEDQSARLKEAYRSTLNVHLTGMRACDKKQIGDEVGFAHETSSCYQS